MKAVLARVNDLLSIGRERLWYPIFNIFIGSRLRPSDNFIFKLRKTLRVDVDECLMEIGHVRDLEPF